MDQTNLSSVSLVLDLGLCETNKQDFWGDQSPATEENKKKKQLKIVFLRTE